MVKIHLVIALLLSSAFGAKSLAEEARASLQRILDERRSIERYSATVLVERKAPEQMMSRFLACAEGATLRLDHERVLFSPNLSQNGRISRVVIKESELLWNHSEYGPELDLRLPGRRNVIDLRTFGLHLAPLANLNPAACNIDNSIIQRVLDGVDRIDREVVNDVACEVISSIDANGLELSVFLEEGTGIYRGCRAIEGRVETTFWISGLMNIKGISFPVETQLLQANGANVSIDEHVVIRDLTLNEPLPRDTLNFAGLGVKKGELVRVRNHPDASGPAEHTELYWDGRKLVDDGDSARLGALSRGISWRVVGGITLVLLSLFWAYRSFGSKVRSKRVG